VKVGSRWTVRSSTGGYWRGYATQATTKNVSADFALKKFFKMVHPDLFPMAPEKKQVNSDSFAKLQRYLASIKQQATYGEDAPFDNTPYTLKFYTTKSPTPASVYVEPCDPQDSQSKKERHLHKTLVSLFTACGYDSGPISTEGYAGPPEANERYAKPGELSLLKFLMSVPNRRKRNDKQKQAEAHVQKLISVQAKALAADLQLKEFTFDIRDFRFLDNVEQGNRKLLLLNKFSAAILELKEKGHDLKNLRGAVVVFGKKKGIDGRGRIVLNADESPSEWTELLAVYSEVGAQQAMKLAKNRMQKEQEIAQLLGVSKFSCDPDLENDFSYEALLKNYVDYLQRTPFKVLPAHSVLRLRISRELPTIEPSIATIVVPVIHPPSAHIAHLDQYASKTIGQFNVFKESTDSMKKGFELASLTYDVPPDLTDDQLWECYKRLQKNFTVFKPYFQGLRLHIGNEYGVNEENNVVGIRWDYLID